VSKGFEYRILAEEMARQGLISRDYIPVDPSIWHLIAKDPGPLPFHMCTILSSSADISRKYSKWIWLKLVKAILQV
jgi:hypothetical protein